MFFWKNESFDSSLSGSNTGIGKQTAIDLARRGARVILACRSKQRGEAALEEVKRVSRLPSLVLKLIIGLPSTKRENDLRQKYSSVGSPDAHSCLL